MANFDLTQAKVAVRLFEPGHVTFGSSFYAAESLWAWINANGDRLYMRGTGLTYVGGHVTAGLVTAVSLDVDSTSTSTTELSISGFSIAAATLDDGADSFWRILDGNDIITGPLKANMTTPGTSYFFGDGITARNAATGGNDVFDIGDTATVVMGDVFNVGEQLPGAPALLYFGGDDIMDGRNSDLQVAVIGDVYHVFANGKLFGGDDVITLRSQAAPIGIGDAYNVDGYAFDFAEVVGGDDVIDARAMLSSTSSVGASLIGDVDLQYFASVTGGKDKLYGSAWNDTLTGDVANASNSVIGAADELYGLDGSDTIVGDVYIASGTVRGGDDIMYGGDGSDEMLGEAFNDLSATLIGGNDSMYGEAGDDFLNGQSGNDVVDGGTGKDTMLGGTGNDQFYVDNSLELVLESAGEGSADRVYASVDYTLFAGQEIEILTTTNGARTYGINLSGNEFANIIVGNNGPNQIDGRSGVDRMTGLGGSDFYFVDNFNDVVIEEVGGGTIDTVATSANYALGINQQIEIFTTVDDTSTAALSLAGNNLANRIIGNNGNNVIRGGAGSDDIAGLIGTDTLDGGTEDDRFNYRGGNSGLDQVNGGAGVDTLDFSRLDNLAWVDLAYAGASGIEAWTKVGSTWFGLANATSIENITGSIYDDQLWGNSQANLIDGGAGADRLEGRVGNDTLNGGEGADSFIYSGSNVGFDQVNGGAGADTLDFRTLPSLAWVDLAYAGSSGVEAWTFVGSSWVQVANVTEVENVTGSAFADQLWGNVQNNLFTGGLGNDRIDGRKGQDRASGGGGSDTFLFAAGASGLTNDTLDIITDFTKGALGVGDKIDHAAALAIGGSAAAASQTQASINASTGVASFFASSGQALADCISDIVVRMTAATDKLGEFAFFRVNGTGDEMLFISDGVAGATADDVVIQLNGINSINSISLSGGDIMILT
jgi:Ca2+-binding RTX toxin-like protein